MPIGPPAQVAEHGAAQDRMSLLSEQAATLDRRYRQLQVGMIL
jgi:hypothetical protein